MSFNTLKNGKRKVIENEELIIENDLNAEKLVDNCELIMDS